MVIVSNGTSCFGSMCWYVLFVPYQMRGTLHLTCTRPGLWTNPIPNRFWKKNISEVKWLFSDWRIAESRFSSCSSWSWHQTWHECPFPTGWWIEGLESGFVETSLTTGLFDDIWSTKLVYQNNTTICSKLVDDDIWYTSSRPVVFSLRRGLWDTSSPWIRDMPGSSAGIFIWELPWHSPERPPLRRGRNGNGRMFKACHLWRTYSCYLSIFIQWVIYPTLFIHIFVIFMLCLLKSIR